MPKLKHNFVQGKMNKDLDERLVPNGQYRDALNIQVSSSEGSDVGAVENILGNTKQNKKTASVNWDNNFSLTNPSCIGIAKDTLNNKIYWFITSDSCDAILEFDEATKFIVPVIVDTRSTSVLNFSKSYNITGINILEGMLFWTDDYNEPRKINISDFKAASATAITGSRLDNTTEIYSRDFLNSDITVIKPSPKQAIDITAKSTKTAANPERGVGVTPVTVALNLTDSNGFNLAENDTVVSVGTISPYIAPSSVFNNKDVRLSHVAFRSDGTKIKYEAIATMSSLTAGEQPGQINGATFTIKSTSSDLPNETVDWDLVLIESEPIFKNNFPRFSYRWKFVDGEYSTYAPFSKAAFVPGKFNYEPENGFNIGMDDAIRKITLTFPTDSYALPPKDVTEIEILYKGVDSNNIYVLDKHKTADGTLSTFDIEKDLLGPVVESLQLLRLYDDVPRKAKSQEIIGNRVVYGNYLHNYTLGDDATITATTTGTAFSSGEKYFGKESVKSDRTYQIGITFLDEFGRETPVFTNKEAAINVEIEDADKKNVISASTAMTTVPSWAEYYKYYVKDPSAEFNNLILDRFYDAEDGNVWLSFPSAERNKISEGEFLILKKTHGRDTSVFIDNRYKVLDIKNEAPRFIKRTNKPKYRTGITKVAVTDFDTDILKFTSYDSDKLDTLDNALKDGDLVQFMSPTGDKVSNQYKIESGGASESSHMNRYQVVLRDERGLAEDDAWLKTGSSVSLFIVIYDQDEENLPEFQGKFFVKVPKTASFESDITSGVGLSEYFLVNFKHDDVKSDIASPTVSKKILSYGNATAGDTSAEPYRSGTHDDFELHLLVSYAFDDDLNTIYGIPGSASNVFNNIAKGEKIRFADADGNESPAYLVTNVVVETDYYDDQNGYRFNFEKKTITVDRNFGSDNIGNNPPEIQLVTSSEGSVNATNNAAVFETKPLELADLELYYEATDALEISGLANSVTLDFKNCYTFGNGVESDRIRDDFNAPLLGKGVRVSTVLQTPYAEERLPASLIYSGIVNTRSGVNNSNQFTTAIKITKDLPNTYGSIQKLHARDTDLIALCEDKIFKILANKDALFNADGNTNVTSSNNVLGQTIPFAGEFGISKNPETFASYGFRAYFTDKSRGTVIRLSRDGITEIADKGMSDYFEDKFKSHTGAISGSYDEASGSYNVTFHNDESVAFKERVDGWVTRLSFTPEFAVSLNNEYYTIDSGQLWLHNNSTRSNFYGTQENTTVTPIFNDAPSSIKNFKTLSYEGDAGWTAAIDTDQQDGEVVTWKKKENIYFNYIKGLATTWNNTTQAGEFDTSEFSIQGIGDVSVSSVDGSGFRLDFAEDINTSLQANVGDQVFVVPQGGSNIFQIGECTSVSGKRLVVDNDLSVTQPAAGDYIFFVKNSEINTSGIIGYYASAKMTTDSGSKKELFAVNSEIFMSSE